MEPDPKKIIGKRIRLARDMKGLTQDQMIQQAPELGNNKSKISNWERGENKPGSEQIEAIARITDTSPSWILMGHGPICSSNRDIQAIRHQNLNYRRTELVSAEMRTGSQRKFSKEEISDYLCSPGKRIADQTARELERTLGEPEGWMDEQHIEHDPVLQALPDGIRDILEFYSELPQKYRKIVLEVMDALKRSLEKLR